MIYIIHFSSWSGTSFMSHSLNPILLVGSTVLLAKPLVCDLDLVSFRGFEAQVPTISKICPEFCGWNHTFWILLLWSDCWWNPTFLGLSAGLWPSGFLGNVRPSRRAPRWRCERRAVKERWLKKLAVLEFLSIKHGLWWDMDGDRMENNQPTMGITIKEPNEWG